MIELARTDDIDHYQDQPEAYEKTGYLYHRSYQHYREATSYIISEKNSRLIKGLLWLISVEPQPGVEKAIRFVAEQTYKKIYNVGVRNTVIANAALSALCMLPEGMGLQEITTLKNSTKYNQALKRIDKVLEGMAEVRDIKPEQLAEQSISDYGLTNIGEYSTVLGEYEAKITISGAGKCDFVWISKNKTQKTTPKQIKAGFDSDFKKIKALIKDINKATTAHSHRIESLLLRKEGLDFPNWNKFYIQHKLIAPLARKLVWRMSEGDSHTDIIFYQDHFVDAQLQPITINQQASFRLWHPSMSSPEEILNWRNLLLEQGITQPFKQAHREIYLLTDAERATHDHSLRFANHAIKQAQFHALAQQRGWNQQRGGGWDGGQDTSASKHYKDYGITAYFNAQGIDLMTTISNVYSLCETESVEFFTKGNKVALEDVPSLLFSEVMRDVDLFVGVASIGNDPAWQDRNDEHWLLGSFGELSNTAITRKEVLSTLIPKLKIADRLSLEGRFLRVQGDLTAYKIHLGSSNILMEPDDSYLCIISTRKKSNVLLPFEGDNTLSLILSKAMLLAEDSKIKDSTILSQIKRTA
ncbi:hypothetical protein GCM10011297_26390 [Bacterioplanes sanyensis]|nr:hypothetical protein GCM10011297_26390 [Bacterioplanes sanyensis]